MQPEEFYERAAAPPRKPLDDRAGLDPLAIHLSAPYYNKACKQPCRTPQVCIAKPHRCVAVLVEAVGRPIAVLPIDASYRIRVWDATIPLSEADVAAFFDAVPTLDVTLEPTVDAVDMDHSHKAALARYSEVIDGAVPALYSVFDGLKGRDAYLGAFRDRFAAFTTTCDRPLNPTPNPHVAPRRKGHSHSK